MKLQTPLPDRATGQLGQAGHADNQSDNPFGQADWIDWILTHIFIRVLKKIPDRQKVALKSVLYQHMAFSIQRLKCIYLVCKHDDSNTDLFALIHHTFIVSAHKPKNR
ncbi:MAG TPA: hypothetical protein DEF07_06250 [Nitrosomonas sp.]|nr:hypothetical protein [Nitrosomonas sp.]